MNINLAAGEEVIIDCEGPESLSITCELDDDARECLRVIKL